MAEESSPLKKTVFIVCLLVFIALASLTASLPLNLPRHQGSMDPQIAINTGETTWMIVATIFGFFLAPAIAYYYATLANANIQKLIEAALVTGSLITTVWIIFSFSLTYGKDAWRNGIMGFPMTFYMFLDTFQWGGYIPNSIVAVFELSFALITPTIVAASLGDRLNLPGWLLFVFAWHIVIWVPIAHIVWHPQGWFYDHTIRDFAGGIVVHQVAAWSAVAVGLVTNTTHVKAPVNKPDNALWYSIIVWFLWFGLNTGKVWSTTASTSQHAMVIGSQVVVNTIAATMSSILSAYFYDMIFERPTTSTTLSSAIILGCVSISSAAGFVTVGGAMCISLFTTLFTFFVAHHVLGEGWEPNHPLSVVTIHGFGGVWGFLGTAIFEYEFINAAGYNGLTYGRGIPLTHHISAVLAIAASVLVTVYVLAFVFNAICPITIGNESAAPAASYNAAATNEPAKEGKADEAGVVSAI